MKIFVKPFVCIAALAIPAIASANVTSDSISVHDAKITYVPSEVVTNYGFAQLERQIRNAAAQVCGLPSKTGGRNGTVRQMIESRQCYDQAVTTALVEVTEKTSMLSERVASQ